MNRSNTATMSLQRFAELADAWGADVTRWPPAEQPGAVRILGSAEGDRARSLLDDAAALDGWLDESVVPASGRTLRDAVLAAAPIAPAQSLRPSRLWRELGGLRIAGPALAAALVMGVALAEVRQLAADEQHASAATAAASAEDVLSAALLLGDEEELL